MGILVSLIRYLGNITNDEENQRANANISFTNSYHHSTYNRRPDNGDNLENHSTNDHYQSRQGKHLTITVPNMRFSSPTNTVVSDKLVRAAAAYAKANDPQNDSLDQKERKKMDVVMINCDERWIKHYSSCHRILLVGEGDFSFSKCLATAFGCASNMIATSLDSEVFLMKEYASALSNIVELSIRKCKVMHEIDATKMASHPLLGNIKFDRVIFNFPFAGFFKKLSRECQLRRHRRLVSLFLKNAREMISENGEIHISHKTNEFHNEWKLESVASSHMLRLIEAVDFNLLDYPGYNTKRGFGGDDNFNCYPSKTYKFGLRY